MKFSALLLILFLACFPDLRAADSIVSEGVIDAPVGAVWEAWTTTAGLKAWLIPNVDIDLRLDGLMRANYDPQGKLGDAGTIENRILAYEPERLLVIRVAKAPEKFPFRAIVGDMWTVLHFASTADGRTHLRVVGLGFGADAPAQAMKTFFQQGNDSTLAQLQAWFRKTPAAGK